MKECTDKMNKITDRHGERISMKIDQELSNDES